MREKMESAQRETVGYSALDYLPALISLVFSAVCIFLAFYPFGIYEPITIAEALFCGAMLLIIPLSNRFLGQNFPNWLNYFGLAFIIISEDLGIFLKFYEFLPYWDLLAHGLSGLLFAVFFAYVLYANGGDKLPVFLFVLSVALAVAGVAGLWEVYEYGMDRLLGTDGQKVAECIAKGLSPLADTMEDIMIAMVGAGVLLLSYLIDKLFGGRLFYKLSPKGEEEEGAGLE